MAVNAQALVAEHGAQRVAEAVAWFDSQTTGSVGPGVLVRAVREGRASSGPRSRLAQQEEYAALIRDWLGRHFPDLDRPRYGPHPAAVVAVIRLHWKHGKGSLTKGEHGPAIYAAVERWERLWGQEAAA